MLLDHLEDRHGPEVLLNRDMFWSISMDELYDIYQQPTTLTIGQLSENWGFLEQIVEERSAPVGYALVWLGEILRALGHSNID
jgi:hypothetical protein